MASAKFQKCQTNLSDPYDRNDIDQGYLCANSNAYAPQHQENIPYLKHLNIDISKIWPKECSFVRLFQGVVVAVSVS